MHAVRGIEITAFIYFVNLGTTPET